MHVASSGGRQRAWQPQSIRESVHECVRQLVRGAAVGWRMCMQVCMAQGAAPTDEQEVMIVSCRGVGWGGKLGLLSSSEAGIPFGSGV